MNNQVCELVGRLARAPQVYVYSGSEKPGRHTVVSSYGFFEQSLDRTWDLPRLAESDSSALACADVAADRDLSNHPLARAVPPAKSLLAFRLPGVHGIGTANMVIVNPEPALFGDPDRMAALRLLISILFPAKQGAGALGSLGPVALPELTAPHFAEAAANAQSSTAAFLLRTLTVKPRMLARNGISYSALRTWRLPIKQFQIEGLRALKQELPSSFIAEIAQEMVGAVVSQWGDAFIKSVVPVPCGSSGRSDCLSVQIGRELALRLGCKFVQALSAAPAPGASHPKKSAKLGEYQLAESPEGATLVVDDVVTSGRHMELALKALRGKGINCFGMSWIAA